MKDFDPMQEKLEAERYEEDYRRPVRTDGKPNDVAEYGECE